MSIHLPVWSSSGETLPTKVEYEAIPLTARGDIECSCLRTGFRAFQIHATADGEWTRVVEGRCFPYWSIVFPLTALSAYLLLGKSRPTKAPST